MARCITAEMGSCQTIGCKNPGPHMICFESEDETPSVGESGLFTGYISELLDALAEWEKSLELQKVLCGTDKISDLIGDGDKDLPRIYNIYKKIKKEL